MLTECTARLPEILLPQPSWHPYPTAAERRAWDGLPPEVRQVILQRGEKFLGFSYPALPATLYLEFARNGNRTRFQDPYYARREALESLVLAECVQGEGRFLETIGDGIWTICEESSWCLPAHISVQKAGIGLPDVSEPIVDLFAGDTVALLAWSDYLLGEQLDRVSPLVRPRIRYEAKCRVLDPCLERDDFWWMGFNPGDHGINNWNPWINSNWLAAVLLLEEDGQRRESAVAKSMRSLERFIDSYGEAGGCDEGPGYWGWAAASLFECLELLYRATGGVVNLYSQPKIQNMGRFIYRTHIHDRYYVNFADASPLQQPPGALIFAYGQRIGDEAMSRFGAWLWARSGLAHWEGFGRQLPALFSLRKLQAVEPAQPLPRDAWFADTQVMVARQREGSAQGFFLAAKGGHNGESHNHNDVGSFMVYRDGKPLVVDAGVETYTRQTFSAQRYELWTMQSAYHTLLPTFHTPYGRLMQAPGRSFAAREVAYQADDAQAQLALDLAGAYPLEAGLHSWRRTVRLRRRQGITVADTYELLQPVAEISLALLTPCRVELLAPGHLALREREIKPGRVPAEAHLRFPAGLFSATVETISIQDEELAEAWGDRLYRVVFSIQKPALKGSWQFEIETG